jgi:hypothetical protein
MNDSVVVCLILLAPRLYNDRLYQLKSIDPEHYGEDEDLFS